MDQVAREEDEELQELVREVFDDLVGGGQQGSQEPSFHGVEGDQDGEKDHESPPRSEPRGAVEPAAKALGVGGGGGGERSHGAFLL